MDEQTKKLKKHLMESEKMSDKDADEKLSKMTDDEKKELSSKADGAALAAEEQEKSKKLAAEDEDKKKKEDGEKLSVARKAFTQLRGKFKTTSEKASAAVSTVQITGRLNGLRAKGKITPAEQKQIDLVRLSALDPKAQDFFFEAYEKRTPVVLAGTYGKTTQVEDIAKVAIASRADKEMLANLKDSMQFSKHLVGQRMSGADAGLPAPGIPGDATEPAVDEPTSMDTVSDLKAHFEHLSRLCAAGDLEGAKAHLSKCMAKLEEKAPNEDAAPPEHNPAHLSALAENVLTLQNQFDELVKLAAPILEITD